MTDSPPPRAPARLDAAGRRLWRQVVRTLELRPDEQAYLEQACRALDLAERLRAEIGDGPLTVEGSKGQPVGHPLLGEWRATTTLVSNLLGRLDLPEGVGTSVEDQLARARSWNARRAARARWSS